MSEENKDTTDKEVRDLDPKKDPKGGGGGGFKPGSGGGNNNPSPQPVPPQGS